jgi:hypothetical protein
MQMRLNCSVRRMLACFAIVLAASLTAVKIRGASEGRTPEQLMAQAKRLGEPLYREILTSERVFNDPRSRAAAAPRALPALKQIIALLKQPSARQPEVMTSLAEFRMMAATFGDSGSRAALEQSRAEPPPVGESARAYVLLVDWYRTNGDPAAQARVLDQFDAAIRDSRGEMLAATLVRAYPRAASDDVSRRIESMFAKLPPALRGESQRRLEASKKLAGL